MINIMEELQILLDFSGSINSKICRITSIEKSSEKLYVLSEIESYNLENVSNTKKKL